MVFGRYLCSIVTAAAVWSLFGQACAKAGTAGLIFTRSGETIEIAGKVPSVSAQAAVLETVSVRFPGISILARLDIVPNAGPPNELAVERALELSAFLADGAVELSGNTAVFSGSTYHPAAMAELAAGLARGWPAGFTATLGAVRAGPQGARVAAAECEQAVGQVADGRIAFEAGRPDIRAESTATIDRIAYAVLRCPDALIAVAGHTDSDGTKDANLSLSLERARAVIDLLVDDGIPDRAVHGARLWRKPAACLQRFRSGQGAQSPHRVSAARLVLRVRAALRRAGPGLR